MGATACDPTRIRKAGRSRMPRSSGMTGGGPGIEARPSLSAARAYARVHRLQYFCRRCVRASRVEGRLRRVFQAELNHFRGSPAAQLRDQGQHEIDASRHAAPGQDVAVPYDATIVDDGAEDRKQFPPRPMAGRAAAAEESGSPQDERSGADRSQIARGPSKPGNLLEKEVIFRWQRGSRRRRAPAARRKTRWRPGPPGSRR